MLQGQLLTISADRPTIYKSGDASELQDIYRRALAASWAAQSEELPADQCVEDIFAGGDGWVDTGVKKSEQDDSASPNGEERHGNHHNHRRTHSEGSSHSHMTVTNKSTRISHKHTGSRDSTGHQERADTIQALLDSPDSPHNETSSENSERGRLGFKNVHEVDEFEIRDDLVAWKLPGIVSL